MAALHPAAAAQLSPLVAHGGGHDHGDGHDHSHENSGALRRSDTIYTISLPRRRFHIQRGDLVLIAAFVIMKILFYGDYALEQICHLTGFSLTVCPTPGLSVLPA